MCWEYIKVRNAKCGDMLRRTWDVVNTHVMAYLVALEVNEGLDFWENPAYTVLFAIDVLMDQLEACLPPDSFVRALGNRDLRRFTLVAGFEPFRRSLLRNGRCPSLGWRLQLSATDYYRLLFLPAAQPQGDQRHASCPYRRCEHFDRVETKHRDGCAGSPGCQFVKSDLEDVIKYITNDSIALIKFEEDDRGQVRIKTVKGDLASDNFTAISHVWAGGMGNQDRNALPQCQLQYILESVTDMPPAPVFSAAEFIDEAISTVAQAIPYGTELTVPALLGAVGVKKRRREALVWIDSLCIPADTSAADQDRISAAKATAINSMAELYAGAEKVLVLDTELQQLSSTALGEHDDILALHIRISPWMARSWPLQEGALGQHIYFQLMDRSILLRESLGRRIGLPSLRLAKYYSEQGRVMPNASLFSQAWNSLVNRSTTKFEDLPAILAVMMENSAEEVLGLAKGDRMKALLRGEGHLPLASLYQPNTSTGGQWEPEIPGADQGQTFIHSHYGTLKSTPEGQEGYLLQNWNDTSFVVVHGVPEGSKFALRVASRGDNTTYGISQGTSVPGKVGGPCSKTVFLLSKLCGVEPCTFHGARFSAATATSGELRLRFETEVLWENVGGAGVVGDFGMIYTNCSLLEDLEVSGEVPMVFIGT